MSMSLIVAFSFARAAGRENYKTLSYKTLPSEEEIVVIFAILVACPYLVKGIAALIAG